MKMQTNLQNKLEFNTKFEIKFKTKICQILLFLNLLNLTPLLAKEQIYDFEMLLSHTLKSSPSLEISKLSIDEALADYDYNLSNFYPTLYVGANTEYSKRFDENYNSIYVGESSLSSSTAYQNSLSLGLRYDLFKFGADYYATKSAKTHITTTKFQNCEDELEIALNLLELYYNGLNLKNQIKANDELKELYEILENYGARLNLAGEMDRVNKSEYALKLSQTNAKILNLHSEADLIINQIYEISNIDIKNINSLMDFNQNTISKDLNFIDFKDSYIYQKLQSQIQENSLTLKSLQKDKFPTISLYAKYDFYGSDKDDYWQSHKNTDRHGYRVGLSINYEIFDGGRKEARIQKQEIINKKLKFQEQSEKLKFQKEQRDIMDFLNTKDSLENSLKAIANETDKIKSYISRLNSVGEKDKFELINSLIASIEAKLDLELHILKSNFTLKKLSLIAEQSKKCE